VVWFPHNWISRSDTTVSHSAKILSVFYDNLDTSDPNDPDVIIKIDVSNEFNTTDRTLTLDMISGRASRDYALRWENRTGARLGARVPGLEMPWNPGTNLALGPNDSNLF
jgi:hypothetical protein